MTVNLLPRLRLLKPSLPLTRLSPMKLVPVCRTSRAIPIFSRVFPFKLKYHALAPRFGPQIGLRRLSTRPFRSRPEPTRGRERGEFRASKSLVDDEAELSDWVGELGRTGSLRGGRPSSDGEDEYGRRDRGRGRGDRDGDRDAFSAKRRRRESESDEWGRRNIIRDSVSSFSRNSRGNKRFERGFESDGFVSRRNNRGRRDFDAENRGRRDFEAESRGRRDFDAGKRQRSGRPLIKECNDDADDDDDNEEEKRIMMGGIEDLISEEDEESDEGDSDGVLKKSEGSLFGFSKGISATSPPSSPGDSGSYLSETR